MTLQFQSYFVSVFISRSWISNVIQFCTKEISVFKDFLSCKKGGKRERNIIFVPWAKLISEHFQTKLEKRINYLSQKIDLLFLKNEAKKNVIILDLT